MNNFNPTFKDIAHQLKSARNLFNINCDWQVPVLQDANEYVPEIDPNYHFDDVTTKAILAGFLYGKKVLLQGLHGTGKSTHIEQVAARLNWGLLRINLDGHISRYDLIGRDVITLRSGMQVTEFQEGMLPWAMGNVCALLFDEYDAARPDVMFVLQRVLEADGKLTLLDQNKVIEPHAGFRIFATANTLGMGDTTGLYHGTNMINQGQLDRWDIVCKLDFLGGEIEAKIVANHAPSLDKRLIAQMVQMAHLTRNGFTNGDLSLMISPRSVIHWAQNYEIFGDLEQSFGFSYLYKCDFADYSVIAELYQRVFGAELQKIQAA
jgi:cobaltochelatase CobS